MKSTKIIAGLGVAAALGVAALPVATFAETKNYSAEVPVKATVNDSIKIEVKDANAADGEDYHDYTAATKADSVEGLAFGTLKDVDFGAISLGGAAEDAEQTFIRVTTNYPNGYTLSAKTTALTGTTTGATIPGTGATYTASTGNTTSGWGFNISKSMDGGSASYIASSGEHAYIGNTEGATLDTVSTLNAQHVYEYKIGYGITVSGTQAADDYAGSATFTVASDATLSH